MVAQEQVQKIKMQKKHETINYQLGLLTGALLFVMIMYFLYQINKEDTSSAGQKVPSGTTNQNDL